ncbi:nitroreductase family protein [Clostridium fungisolvens]|uniref:Ion-translocating oxidoreductase complex subunit B n=1 Tax=Clostridium fungisolvens TaxID=1604897 RepID=A0A6V8SMF9_9CLOT|nr:nitroreductase family protein [Clostridium fungisolvens]GFP76063.1 Ion-translocating oxidoreductase complex subunit B [Clostridium fungisolvens]
MMNVNTEKCIGCGLCVKDCFVRDIEMVDGKAKIKNEACFKCGHCVAICPKEAVSTDDYNMEEVKAYNKDEFEIEPERLLNFIKFRRTVRQFQAKDIEIEKLNKIIDAGRFTQTGSNAQNVSYVVVRENLNKLKALAFEGLSNYGKYMLNNLTPETAHFKRYAEMWIQMNEEFKADNTKDKLFFNAPAVVLVLSESEVNGALASSNMELMVDALGLGTFFSGFFVRAAQGNKEIMELLGINEGQKIVTCMVIGYPAVKYSRTVPRKDAVVSWK